MLTSSLIRHSLAPMAGSYLAVMVSLAIALRRQHRADARPGPGQGRQERGRTVLSGPPRFFPRITAHPLVSARSGWPALIRHAVVTGVSGYLVLMAVVIGYYYGVAHVGGQFISSAFTGNALLMGLATPVFAALSWAAERWRRHRTGVTEGRIGRPGRPLARAQGPGERPVQDGHECGLRTADRRSGRA